MREKSGFSLRYMCNCVTVQLCKTRIYTEIYVQCVRQYTTTAPIPIIDNWRCGAPPWNSGSGVTPLWSTDSYNGLTICFAGHVLTLTTQPSLANGQPPFTVTQLPSTLYTLCTMWCTMRIADCPMFMSYVLVWLQQQSGIHSAFATRKGRKGRRQEVRRTYS